MKLINKSIAEYSESFTTEEPEIVRELVEASKSDLQYIDMLSGRQVGILLNMLVKISGARRILEVGSFTGYSALMMADALPDDGELITCELNERYTEISEHFFSKEPYKQIISQILGDAQVTIPKLTGRFDLIYLDADKVHYPEYYQLIREKVTKGGLIVVDNTLWGGEVLDPHSDKAKAIHKLNEMIRDDTGVRQVMLPVRDGLTVVRVEQ